MFGNLKNLFGLYVGLVSLFGDNSSQAEPTAACPPPPWYLAEADDTDLWLSGKGEGSSYPRAIEAARNSFARQWLLAVFGGTPHIPTERPDIENHQSASPYDIPLTGPPLSVEMELALAEKDKIPSTPGNNSIELIPEGHKNSDHDTGHRGSYLPEEVREASEKIVRYILTDHHHQSKSDTSCGMRYAQIKVNKSKIAADFLEPKKAFEHLKVILDRGLIAYRTWLHWQGLLQRHDSKIKWIKSILEKALAIDALDDYELVDLVDQLEYAHKSFVNAAPAQEFYFALNEATKLSLELEPRLDKLAADPKKE